MKTKLIILLSFTVFSLTSQQFEDCVSINFESLPNQTPQENLPINTQYLAEYGVTFSLEDGTTPVLADVGGNLTAFSSNFGGDTPAPGQDIGNFFITDDGLWSGSTSPALLVNFAIPIDSFAACVLDIDGGEQFVIEARGASGNIIQSITITDGDPGTGDAQSTCFGFNASGCEGSIYSIRFKGVRPDGSTFGLGMDNFSFCPAGTDIITQIQLDITPLTCQSMTGSVTVINLGSENYTYALDNGSYQSNPIFSNLSQGFHNISIKDAEGCKTTTTFLVEGESSPEITDLSTTPTSCGADNGAIIVFTSSSSSLQYAINGGAYQASNIFNQLPSGNYTITVIDANNCLVSELGIVAPSEPLTIESIVTQADYCNDSKGEISIIAQGGSGVLEYHVLGSPPSLDPIITNLPAGNYTIEVSDEVGCLIRASDSIPSGTPFWIDELNSQDPSCEATDGHLFIHATGGTGLISYWLNEDKYHPTGHFIHLPSNVYQLSAIDEFGCQVDTIAQLGIPQCPIYTPNGFSPNQDGINDIFRLFTNTHYDVQVEQFMIFDRWGELVWIAKDFTIHTAPKWWNGEFKNQAAQQGVYTYVIEVKHQNGQKEFLAGDVTLVR